MENINYKQIARLEHTSEGIEFINYLEQLSLDNYRLLKYCEPSLRDIFAGKAQAIDEIISFIKIDIKDLINNAENINKESAQVDLSTWAS